MRASPSRFARPLATLARALALVALGALIARHLPQTHDVPPRLSPAQRVAARIALSASPTLRSRFLSAASDLDRTPDPAARASLQRTLACAARRDLESATTHLRTAESALDAAGSDGVDSDPASDPARLALHRLHEVSPAIVLARDLQTESWTATRPLVERAAWLHAAGQHGDCARLLAFAGRLLAAPAGAPAPRDGDPRQEPGPPDWFAPMAKPPETGIDPALARATLDLATAAIGAEPDTSPTRDLVTHARRAMDRGSTDDARWWATIALDALGIAHPSPPAPVTP